MASSKGSPGPHDRRDPTKPRPTCSQKTRKGVKCKRFLAPGQKGKSDGLCRFHLEKARRMMAEAQGLTQRGYPLGLPEVIDLTDPSIMTNEPSNFGHGSAADFGAKGVPGGPANASAGSAARAGISTQLTFEHAALARRAGQTPGAFALNERARLALSKIGLEPNAGFDPKTALLATVESAWRQARVWEAMLTQIPDEDWQYVGTVPIPGLIGTAKGARIELIQRNLAEATKTSAKVSKMAIDAGIEERLVRLAEEQSALIADTVRAGIVAAIASLRLTPKNEALALEAALQSAASRLRVLASGDLSEESPSAEDQVFEGVAVEVLKS